MKHFLLVCVSAIALSGCAATITPGYVAPTPVYTTPAPVYGRPHYHHRPVCRQVFSHRDYYGRPVFRTVCH